MIKKTNLNIKNVEPTAVFITISYQTIRLNIRFDIVTINKESGVTITVSHLITEIDYFCSINY